MNKKFKKLMLLAVSGILCLSLWHQQVEVNASAQSSIEAKESTVKTGFFTGTDGSLYYANVQGSIVKNRSIKHKKNVYFADTQGRILRKTFVYYDGKKYSKSAEGLGTIKSKYYVDENGRRKDSARLKVDGKYYYTKKNGKLYIDTMVTYKSKKYYVNKNGAVAPNRWITRNSSLYRTNGKGEVRKSQSFKRKKAKFTVNKAGKVVNTVMPIPALYQYDYPHLSFGNVTIKSHGCGVVATTMAMRYLTGKNISVKRMRNIANPYFDPASAIDRGKVFDEFFMKAAKTYGKKVEITTSAKKALAAAKKGSAVLSFQRRPSIFANYGHFIVIKAVDSKNKVRINDPYDTSKKNYNKRTFDFYKDINKSSIKYVIFSH